MQIDIAKASVNRIWSFFICCCPQVVLQNDTNGWESDYLDNICSVGVNVGMIEIAVFKLITGAHNLHSSIKHTREISDWFSLSQVASLLVTSNRVQQYVSLASGFWMWQELVTFFRM